MACIDTGLSSASLKEQAAGVFTGSELPREAESTSTKRPRDKAEEPLHESMGGSGHPNNHGQFRIPTRAGFTAPTPVAEEMQHIILKDSTGIRLPTHHNSRPYAVADKLARHAKVVAKLCDVH